MESKKEKPSRYVLIPLPDTGKKITIKEGTTEIGRRTLTEQLGITSQTHPKKMSVSRVQVVIKATEDKLSLKSVGLNQINLTLRSQTFPAVKDKTYFLHSGDAFTLCGQHFPFAIAISDNVKPRPSHHVLEAQKHAREAAERHAARKAKRERESEEDPDDLIRPPTLPDLTGVDPTRKQQIMEFYEKSVSLYQQQQRQILQMKLRQSGMTKETIYREEKQYKKKAKTDDKKLHKFWSVGAKVEVQRKDGGTKTGVITNYDEQLGEYEVTFSDGVVSWKGPDQITLIPVVLRRRNGSNRSGSVGRSESPSSDSNRDNSEESGASSSEASSASGEENGKRRSKERGSRRVRKAVAYFEWPSESSSSEDVSDEDAIRSTTKTTRPSNPRKARMGTNWTRIQPLLSTVHKTAILYSDICLKHYVPRWHLERPSRVSQVMEAVRNIKKHFGSHLTIIEEFPKVSRDVLLMVHDEVYVTKMEKQKIDSDTPQHATQFSVDDTRVTQDQDTFMSLFSFEAALTAAGAVCKAIDLVSEAKFRNAFCCVRPPGHHCGIKGHTAEASSQGYCIINNIAVGAMYATRVLNYKKVAVVDFDVHHGNGTEEILSGGEKFYFISIHVGDIYPGTGADDQSRASNVLNISLKPGDTSDVFRAAFDKQIIPALERYSPDLLLLSSGFDGHKNDPTDDGLRLEEPDYAYITDKLLAVADKYCGGKLVSVLEGGYNLPALRKSAKEHILSLMKKAPSEMTQSATTTTAVTQQTTTQVTTSPNGQTEQMETHSTEVVRMVTESSGSLPLSI